MRFKEACKAQDHYWMDRITRLTDGEPAYVRGTYDDYHKVLFQRIVSTYDLQVEVFEPGYGLDGRTYTTDIHNILFECELK